MRIFEDVLWLTREEWGARTDLGRLGYTTTREGVPVAQVKDEVIFHHTVIVDSDTTKNIWETEAEIKNQMRRLQMIRPDLGNDVPYNIVLFLQPHGKLIACEGRGFGRTGAHTPGHNTKGLGIAFQGDFEGYLTRLNHWVPAVNQFLGWAKGGHNPKLATIAIHKDYTATVCPGKAVAEALGGFSFIQEGTVTTEQALQDLDKRQKQASVLMLLAARALAATNVSDFEANLGKATIDQLPRG